MMILCAACLATLSGCETWRKPATGGEFCDVVTGPIAFPPPVARVVVAGARPEAVRLDAQNRYGNANCPGWAQE